MMSAIVTGVLKLTFGILTNKIRSGIAERLKDGDITDEECRRLFVTELDDIKSKLDGLARKDLLSSLCFLQEGINGLYQSLQSDSNKNAAESIERVNMVEGMSSRDSDSTVNEVINVITSLKLRSNDCFKSTTESFKLAREKATEAFCNEALSIEDRIQATQIRMMARILEKLDNPNASVNDCLQYLKQLHDIGAIQETFSVLIDGGIKLRFNKTKRLDHAWSVQLMNQILFEFARKFTKLPLRYLESWPVILFGKKSYRPLFQEADLVGKLKDCGMQVMSINPDSTFNDEIVPWLSVVNNKGEILALTRDESTLKIFERSGESRTRCEVPREEHASNWDVTAMDIDAEDKIYLITTFRKKHDQLRRFKLFIFDENGNKKLESLLPFDQNYNRGVRMTINKDGKIAILDCMEKTLHIGKVCFKQNLLKFEKFFSPNQLEIDDVLPFKVMFADFNTAKIIAADQFRFYIYAENGQIQHKCKINAQEENGLVESIAINHVMKRILVRRNNYSSGSSSLLSFSETGELIDSLYLGSSEWIKNAVLISHPNGPVALVGETGVALLQL